MIHRFLLGELGLMYCLTDPGTFAIQEDSGFSQGNPQRKFYNNTLKGLNKNSD